MAGVRPFREFGMSRYASRGQSEARMERELRREADRWRRWQVSTVMNMTTPLVCAVALVESHQKLQRTQGERVRARALQDLSKNPQPTAGSDQCGRWRYPSFRRRPSGENGRFGAAERTGPNRCQAVRTAWTSIRPRAIRRPDIAMVSRKGMGAPMQGTRLISGTGVAHKILLANTRKLFSPHLISATAVRA